MKTSKKGDYMKKTISILFAVIFCFFFFGCNKDSSVKNSSTTIKQEISTEEGIAAKENISFMTTNVNNSNTYTFSDEGGQGGGELLPRKYRNNYYQIPLFFSKIVDEKEYLKWESEYYANNYADDTNVMVMVAFIKEFDISREDFEKANLEYAKFIDEIYHHICLDPQDYADQEMQEIYNTDIIYTFDNELINEYYLGIDYPFLNEYQYVEAVENGTYKTQTTDFVDIEQMEAEINAKYGTTETEVTTESQSELAE